MSRHVVVGVDGTGRSVRAVMWAAHTASLRAAPLRLVHALPRQEVDFPLFPPGRFEEAEKYGAAMIEEATSLVRDAYPDVDVTSAMPMGTPTDVLRQESRSAGMVVIGAKGENLGNVLLGSTALQLVGHATCPVVVVCHVTTGHHKVVVGTDGSPDATAALGYAFEEASLRKATLHVISALGLPQGWPTHLLRPLPEDDEEVDKRRQAVENQVAPLREEHPDVAVEVDVHRFAPIHTLADASHRSDLIVLGSRGRGGFHGLAVGSVTHQMLHLADCPIAVVRAEG